MSSSASVLWRRPRRVVPIVLLAVLLPATLLAIVTLRARDASAHGSVVNPMSRNYSCWKRWGSQFQSPAMATEDPMCDQAWKADPNAMWNWNGLYREGVAGNHQAAIPDGQLCSGGQTGGTRYAALDNPGPWTATRVPNSFQLTVHDQARHGADYYKVYVTRQGFDPLTQRLRWSDLELVTTTGRIAPGVGSPSADQVLNGVNVGINVNAGTRTGRHVVYTIWQASHSDQSYYLCSDVIFGQGADPGTSGPGTPTPTIAPPTTWGPAPTTTPSPTPTTATPTPTTPAPITPTTTTPLPTTPGVKACAATYRVVSSWPSGFQGEVKVTAGGGAISGWRVTAAFPSGQTVNQAWNASVSGTGSSLVAGNVAWNGSLAPGASTSFGFLATSGSTDDAPTLTCTAS
jgi:predicted carbohydrate-binding protein with CBM5 and CBM33 domain